jgi:hypothetical protein
LNIPSPPHPLPQKRFSKSFPKKKRKQIIFGFDVWLAWWVIKSRGSDDASVHARKQIMADGVDVTECLARVCSRQSSASG